MVFEVLSLTFPVRFTLTIVRMHMHVVCVSFIVCLVILHFSELCDSTDLTFELNILCVRMRQTATENIRKTVRHPVLDFCPLSQSFALFDIFLFRGLSTYGIAGRRLNGYASTTLYHDTLTRKAHVIFLVLCLHIFEELS